MVAARSPRLLALAATAVSLAVSCLVAPLGCRERLAAPIPAMHRDETPRPGGTLRLASFGDIRNLDPAGPTDGVALTAQQLIFAGLVDYDAAGHLAPDLADHWHVDDDGRTYRFFLRSGVFMHDGEELTADDAKRSIERALHPTAPNPNASYFQNIAGYEAYAAGRADRLSGVVVEGRYAVSFHLNEPDTTFLPMLVMPMARPVCKTAGDRYVDTWTACDAGPFALRRGGWHHGASLRLERHDGYFRPGLPYLDGVEWTFNIQFLPQRFRFEAGQLDVLRDMTQADQPRFLADPRWRALGSAEEDTGIYGESMNTRMAPFDNVEIRRAVAAAIDREHYKALKPANVTVVTQLLPPDAPGYDPTVEGQRYDYAAALEHMRRAGYAYDPQTGVGGWPKPIVYPLYDGGLLVSTAQLLQQDLAKIGLRLDLKLVTYPTFLALQERPDGAAMSQANWGMDYPDASAFFDPLFTSSAIGKESTYNTAFFSNARFDDRVARAHHEADSVLRRALYHEANAILCDQAPWAFAFAYHFYDVRQPYVRGLAHSAARPMDVSRVWLDDTAGALPRGLSEALP